MAEEKEKRAPEAENEPERPFTEQLEVAGEELVERVKELLKQGNIRRLIIKSADGRILLQVPLTLGVVVGGGLMFFYPILAMLTAIGGLVARVHIEIVREEEGDVVTELDVDSQDVTRKAEEFVNDMGKRLERATSGTASAGKQKIDLEDDETDNNLQA